MTLLLSDEAQRYARSQRGNLYNLPHKEWRKAFDAYLLSTLDQIEACVGCAVGRVLDIGSGIGAIDVLLRQRYGCGLVLLDGNDDGPTPERSDRTHNHQSVTSRFLLDNGVEEFTYLTPDAVRVIPCDLILSFASWCFHYPPSWYLDYVRQCALPGAHLVIDIRIDRPSWREEMRRAFKEKWVVQTSRKFERVHFQVGP